jgi:hypothetical protein
MWTPSDIKNLANVNIGVFLKTEVSQERDGGSLIQCQLKSG